MLAFKRVSSGLAATLLLWASMAIATAPAASAVPAICTYVADQPVAGFNTLTVQLRGNDASFSAATATTTDFPGADITVAAASGCSSTYTDVSRLDIYGSTNGAETVTFVAASTDSASPWDGIRGEDEHIDLTLGSGADDEVILEGTSGDDDIAALFFAFSYSGVDKITIDGDAGDDDLEAMSGVYTEIYGGAGEDVIAGREGDDLLDGGDDADVITGGDGDDFIHGGDDASVDDMSGGDGDDTFYECFLATDSDPIDGGPGIDTVDYSDRTADITVDLAAGTGGDTAAFEEDDLTDIENVITGSGDDQITGDDNDNVIDAGTGDDFVDGGDGDDTIDYGNRTGSVTVTVESGATTSEDNGETGLSEADSLTQIENARTGSGNDFLYGDGTANALEAGGGNDFIEGLEGADVIDGGEGNDTIDEGSDDASRDEILGGSGTDLVDYSARTAGVKVNLTNAAGEDTFSGDIENVNGGSGGDDITGNSLNNAISGNDGDDVIDGFPGRDTLTGGTGYDRVFGGDGDDTLDGTKDGIVDLLYGGAHIKGDKCNVESTAEIGVANSCETFVGVSKKTRP